MADQLRSKQDRASAAIPQITWDVPVVGPENGYRNRAKLVVGGTVEAPTLGILDEYQRGVDLTGCGVYETRLAASFEPLRAFVSTARLVPYDVPSRHGELKYLLVTVSPEGDLMVRFVLRSTEALARIRKYLPELRRVLPNLVVVSVNVQPVHAQLLEGDQEILLTDTDHLDMQVGEERLRLPTRSFFQTNSAVAGALYRRARIWADDLAPRSVWDLYCGVGGFALHLAAPGRHVLGIEVSESAVAAARHCAQGRAGIEFIAGDVMQIVDGREAPDLVVVNPPRRGLGALARWIEDAGVASVLYSSCNIDSLAADLAEMPHLHPVRAQLLDMFPQTPHAEALVFLSREAS